MANVNLQCQLNFPIEYPDAASPTLDFGRMALIDHTTLARIDSEVYLIAQAYVSHRRCSLEAIIRYLQGEFSASEITLWTKQEQEHSILDHIDNGEASSSDEEDEENPYSRHQTDEAGLSGSGLISAGMANANVPLPKACGAVWADNGHLVCFFPRKEDMTQSFLGSLGLEAVSKEHDDLFARFGRLQNSSPARKSKVRALETIKGGDFDSDPINSDSDTSYYSSSDSSDSSDASISPRPTRTVPLGLYAWRKKAFVAPRIESIIGESRNSNSSVDQSNH